MEKEKVITGNWNGEPIWRWETPEETLERNEITVEVGNLFIALNEK